MYLGLAIAWGVVWMLLPSFFFSALTVLTTIKEEEFLLRRFGRQYEKYMQDVPWRLIPKIFSRKGAEDVQEGVTSSFVT
jgi:protein-S-isoprenylcysteine O-methyltransferase Ste14